ncbi:MAG TPA: hypothetical protein PLX06_00020 [Fimbriimonadaceae bacterium]|nr:hypothetical protein [Fimbriimonadaceae bacterium]
MKAVVRCSGRAGRLSWLRTVGVLNTDVLKVFLNGNLIICDLSTPDEVDRSTMAYLANVGVEIE